MKKLALVPRPSDAATALRMQTQRQRDTYCEVIVRRELYRLGMRYRIDCRPVPNVPRRADIVIRPAKVAVFIDGCFWHGCPLHWKPPNRNTVWWTKKIKDNARRDRETTKMLRKLGWLVIRVWEHEAPETVADQIFSAVCARRPGIAELRGRKRSVRGAE
jgi:DNA mismatch endonuclease, patch repair protein